MSETAVIDLLTPVETPADGIVSRTIHSDDCVRAVLFSFAAGQQLSDHTASVPVTVTVMEGEAEVIVGGETYRTRTGSWLHIGPNVPHSVVARTPLTMVLTLIKACKAG